MVCISEGNSRIAFVLATSPTTSYMVCILVGKREDKLHLVRPCGQAGPQMHCLHLGEQRKDKLHCVPLGRREGK